MVRNLFGFLKRRTCENLTKRGRGTACKHIHFLGAVSSDVGCVRSNNEDNFLLGQFSNVSMENTCKYAWNTSEDSWMLAGVFDGMGGGDAGEIAAYIAAEVFRTAQEKLDDSTSATKVDMIMRECFLTANNMIVDLRRGCGVYGTTGTVLVANGTNWKVYHIGDSRVYLFRDGQLVQQSRDQTLAQMKIDVGIYSAEDNRATEEKHKLTEYIGKDHTKKHIRPLEGDWMIVHPGDRFLLCSDGLYDMCSEQEIAGTIATASDPIKCVDSLVKAACAHGGDDNVTCLCLQID